MSTSTLSEKHKCLINLINNLDQEFNELHWNFGQNQNGSRRRIPNEVYQAVNEFVSIKTNFKYAVYFGEDDYGYYLHICPSENI